MNFRNNLLILICLLSNIYFVHGQYQKIEQTVYIKSRIDTPIKAEVIQQGDKYVFYASNRSFYSYQLNVEFSTLINLTPETRSYSFITYPGQNMLFSLTVKDKKVGHSFAYNISYSMGIASKKVSLEYPYLIPLSTDKTIELYNSSTNRNMYVINAFKSSKGDTAFNMRKGYVAAVPDMFNEVDRISESRSLEIIHKDGTIMVYNNVDPDNVFVKPGKIIYPGQALGLVKSPLLVNLYMVQKERKLKEIDIKYFVSDSRIEPFSKDLVNIEIKHPDKIITKEMTRREIKKYNTKKNPEN